MQTSPISFVAHGKGTACGKGNRRRLHAGNFFVSVKIEKRKKAYCARVIIKATSPPRLLRSQDLDQLRRIENDQ